MKRWLISLLLGLVVGGLLAGCARNSSEGASAAGLSAPGAAMTGTGGTNTSKLIVTPGAVAGTVSLVNANARYVVVTYPVGVLPEVGRRLNVYRGGLKVGEIQITGPQRDVNTVADIVAGEAQKGDEVRPD